MKLIALRCLNCTQPLPAENEDVVVVCGHCGTAVVIDDRGLSRIEVCFAMPTAATATAVPEETGWLPFWVFDGRVHIQKRETQGGNRTSQGEAEQLWGTSRRLYVPAWNLPLQQAQAIGSTLVQAQPDYHLIDKPATVSMTAAIIAEEDALKLLEFIILAIEARRPDYLKDLVFKLEMGPGQLWALPANAIRAV